MAQLLFLFYSVLKSSILVYSQAMNFIMVLTFEDIYASKAINYGIYILKNIFIPFLLLVICISIGLLLKHQYSFDNKLNKKKLVAAKVDLFLTELLFLTPNSLQIPLEVKRFIQNVPFKKQWCKNLILNKILDLKQNIEGIDPTNFDVLYSTFGFQSSSSKLLDNKGWHHQLLGIYHYQTLGLKSKIKFIEPLLNSELPRLRANTLIALMTLADNKIQFLSNYKDPLSQADEIKILDLIFKNQSSLPKNAERLLSNTNETIIVLGIKIITHYKSDLSMHQVRRLLKKRNKNIKKEIIISIGKLNLFLANPLLIETYKLEADKELKILLLRSLTIVGDFKTISFARILLIREFDFDIKFEIISCIHRLNKNYLNDFNTQSMPGKKILTKIIKHINDPYLN